LLVDRDVLGIEDNECSGTVGVAFEDSLGSWRDGEEKAKLIRKSGCGEIAERELDSSVASLDVDLERNQSIQICC
jgi:hypothetical protein